MASGVVISGDKTLFDSLHLALSRFADVRKVGTVPEGIKTIINHPADFAILDSCIRDGDAVEAVGKLLHIQKTLPIIVLVPSIHAPLVDEVRAAGAHLVLEKPFDRRALAEIVESAIERTRLLNKIEYLKAHAPHSLVGEGIAHASESQCFYREVVRRFAKAISQVFDHRKLLDLAVEAIVETFSASKAAIFLADSRTGKYVLMSCNGYPKELAMLKIFDQVDELPVRLSKHNQILLAHSIPGETEFELYEQMNSLDAEVVAGLCAKGKLIGFVAIGPKTTGKGFFDNDIELLSIFCSYLAMAIENALLYRDIARSRAHNENVLNCIRTGIVTIDAQGLVTFLNATAEEILEIKKEDIVGLKVEKIGSMFADLLLRTLAGEKEYTRSEVLYALTKKPLGISTSAMHDEDGAIDGAIMAFADLSRIKALEEKERDFERIEFWSKVASRMAHEVKNPLVSIKTFAQLLPQRYKDSEFREEFYRIVNSEIDRLNGIINQLTKFADSSPPQPKAVEIHKVIESALASAKAGIAEKKAKVTRHFVKDQVTMLVDSSLLTEAFANIIDNAADAIKEGGNITISTAFTKLPQSVNGAISIVFKDDGKGMAEDELKDVFTPFATSKVHGMGLGLAIARRIVMDHKGIIEMDSAPNRGSAIKVVIPITNSAPAAQS